MLAGFAGLSCTAQTVSLAATPPMGWNSWDSFGLTITEEQFNAAVDVLAKRLKPAGWRYAVIDEGWYLENPESALKPETLRYTRNALGQYSPALNRFPSAADGAGLKPIGDRVHQLGLLFGLHIIRGIPKETVARDMAVGSFHASEAADQTDLCPWNPDNFGVRDNAAGQAWYDALMTQYAGWGVDYLKVDCIASHPYRASEIAMIHRAIAKTGRPMVLSLSPGPTALENAGEVQRNAQLWRISDDVWDFWDRVGKKDFPTSVKRQFATLAAWQPYAKPGSWPDADMLPVGELRPSPGYGEPRRSRLTAVEQRTMLTLWAIARSPLFFGGNLTQMDPPTAALLTNAEVIALDQQGHDQKPAGEVGEVIAWTSEGAEGRRYLALFNVGELPVTVKREFRAYGLPAGKFRVRRVWEGVSAGSSRRVSETIPAHGSVLLELR